MKCVRVPGLKAPNVIARAEGPGTPFHKLFQGLKGRDHSPHDMQFTQAR
jgi:hypothetical protein